MEALAQTPALAPEVKAPPREFDVPEGVEAYVQRFTEIWAEPRNAESFTDRFMDYVDPDITMIQPPLFYPMCHGVKGFKKQFRRYFTALPDLNGQVIRWSAMGDTVWIELDLTCWHGRRPHSFRVIDRTIMRNGRAIERRVFGDPTSLLLATLARPWAWPRVLLSYLRPR